MKSTQSRLYRRCFVFSTDGILEARNEAGEEFGYERLEKTLRLSRMLSANEMRDAIATAVREHCYGLEPDDDQTLIVFKVGERSRPDWRRPLPNLRVRTGELKFR